MSQWRGTWIESCNRGRPFGNASMEMHQVRYFLAVARTLNFTRAADECHVAQPSLTRAIKLLEGELGGELFRRERPRAMLTPLGERMYPLLKQCYDSAQSARSLAAMINDGEVGSLKIAVSSSIELGLILNAGQRTAPQLQRDRAEDPARHRAAARRVSEGRRRRARRCGVDRRGLGPARYAGSCSTSRSTWCSTAATGWRTTRPSGSKT